MTDKQTTYIDAKMKGRNPSTILGSTSDCEKSDRVQTALAEARTELQEEVKITRADVVNGIKDAIERARLQAEPATEIAGWREIGKILGHYAPEVKSLILSESQDKVVRKLESMSTQELLEMVERKKRLREGAVVNGEATRIDKAH